MLTWLVPAIVALTALLTPTGAALASWSVPQAKVVWTVGERIVELHDDLRSGRNATASAARSLGRAQLSPPGLGVPSPALVLRAAGASTALTGLGRAQRSEHGRPSHDDPRGSNLGERLITRTGTAEVTSLTPITGAPVSVFNLEVGGSHQYFVHETEVLAHNTYGGAARGVSTAQGIASKISGSLKCFGRCADFASALQGGLQKAGVSGTRIEIQVGKGITPYSNKFGALAERGRGHTAVRVGDTVFDNFRPGGVPYSEFIDDLGGADFFGTPFVKVIESAF